MNHQIVVLARACLGYIHPDISYIGLNHKNDKLILNFIIDVKNNEISAPLREALDDIISYFGIYNYEMTDNNFQFETEIQFSEDANDKDENKNARAFYIRFVPYDDYESL